MARERDRCRYSVQFPSDLGRDPGLSTPWGGSPSKVHPHRHTRPDMCLLGDKSSQADSEEVTVPGHRASKAGHYTM